MRPADRQACRHRRRLLVGGAVAASLLVGGCSSQESLPEAAPAGTASPTATTTQDPPCTVGASSQACHGWTNTRVQGGSVAFAAGGSTSPAPGDAGPFLQSMTCTYNVPDVPTQADEGTPSTTLYLYCQVVAAGPDPSSVQAFGQLAPQIALGQDFDTCEQARPLGPTQWYMQAMYFWRSPDGKGQCLGGTIYPVSVGAQITSTIAWDVTNGWWDLSITDGTNTSSYTVQAPSSPTGENASMSWSDFDQVVPGGSFELWNGVQTGSYPVDDWIMTTTFSAGPDTANDPFPPMVPVGTDSNATRVSCTSDSVCTWTPPS